jgi:hypothetical protein
MSIEDIGMLRSEFYLRPLSNCEQLAASKTHRCPQPASFAINIRISKRSAKDMAGTALYP